MGGRSAAAACDRPALPSPVRTTRIKRMRNNGWTWDRIGKHYGVHHYSPPLVPS